MRPVAASIVGAFVASLLACGPGVAAEDAPLQLIVDGRAFDRGRTSALVRDGVAYVDVVRGVRAVDGLLALTPGGTAAVTIGGRTLAFRIGRKSAMLEARSVALPGAPFVLDGDTFVPLAAVATLAEAKLTVDPHDQRALLARGRGDGYAPPPRESSGDEGDIAPSPTQALSFLTTGTTDATGLHARVQIINRTPKVYVVPFSSAGQVAFIVSRNGSEVWSSLASVAGSAPTTLTIPAHGSVFVSTDYPDFDRLGPGRYLLRVRLMTESPIDFSPISLGVVP